MAEQLAAKKAAINKGVEIDESKLGSGGGEGDGESLPLNILSENETRGQKSHSQNFWLKSQILGGGASAPKAAAPPPMDMFAEMAL